MILFIADIHVKLGQKNVPKEWANRRYDMFIEQLNSIPHSLCILGGDIFDRMPTLEELEVYFKLVSSLKHRTLIYDGNHEATKKNHTFFDVLREVTEAINPLVEIVTKTTVYDKFTILPFADLHRKNSIEDCPQDLPLFTHVRGEIPPHVKPEVDLARLQNFPIVYAGDLHSHSNTQRNIVYPGSPMTTSFHRNLVETGYLLIDEDDLTKWSWHKFELPQLLRKTVEDTKDMVATEFHHTIYEIEGDLQQLSGIANTELLDKKIVRRNSEVTVDLTNKSIQEELEAYLKEVLLLPPETTTRALEVFNANFKGS
jgi:DNA repair exonuclease SbcCD nuclease subunit